MTASATRIVLPYLPDQPVGTKNRRAQHGLTQVQIWIGLDVGKEFHHAVVLDDAGDVVADRRVVSARPIWWRSSTPRRNMALSFW